MDPQRLREATRAEHEATEALMPLSGEALTRETYIRVLQTLEPLIRSWETWAMEAAPEDLRALLARRHRSHLLEADLQTMGAERMPLPGVHWAEVVAGPGGREQAPEAYRAAFLGGMYVLEGSTLGGRFIARMVERSLGLESGRGDSYFQGHGEATGSLWREVTAQLAALPETQDLRVIGGARCAFRLFGEGLRAGLHAPEMVQLG